MERKTVSFLYRDNLRIVIVRLVRFWCIIVFFFLLELKKNIWCFCSDIIIIFDFATSFFGFYKKMSYWRNSIVFRLIVSMILIFVSFLGFVVMFIIRVYYLFCIIWVDESFRWIFSRFVKDGVYVGRILVDVDY